MSVQVIEKNGVPEYAVIPYKEYQRLVEQAQEAQDLTDAEAAVRAIEAGEETIPEDVVERLLSGEEHPIKVWREYRGLTQEALGERAGVGKSYISQLEARSKDGSTRVIKALANALAVDIDDLLEE
ncbi:transcriptional regulator [Halovibrio salipaludis]|uniref:Transcriptional regulator n=1 Tax=Halovibrio salipaludis TaxID=2032626 RepID=A0A2A2FCN3_9GAMM|nr:helix-turn-helix transcriptional regulator [Halovibrio salipaludis]PAU82447.1 transcriptional regulator [Halovibrio salipaludis]